MLCISAWKRCYCIDLWINMIMCIRMTGCQKRIGKECQVARWLYYVNCNDNDELKYRSKRSWRGSLLKLCPYSDPDSIGFSIICNICFLLGRYSVSPKHRDNKWHWPEAVHPGASSRYCLSQHWTHSNLSTQADHVSLKCQKLQAGAKYKNFNRWPLFRQLFD